MRIQTVCLVLCGMLVSASAAAQTWVESRTTPVLDEIFAIDATGEPGWLYGFEDLAGDGEEFKQQEQSIDIRTAYAATDTQRFWVRLYVSDPHAAGGNVTAFVFIDSDEDTQTGGTAAAPEIHPALTADSSAGGYDYVIEIRGTGTIGDIWEWSRPQQEFQGTNPPVAQAEAETDLDIDPININEPVHGYLQGMVDLSLVGLTPACDANLYVRSVHETGGMDSDLEVGVVGPCVPADENDDGVPDLVVPVQPCETDDQCPGGGICVDGVCVVPEPCLNDEDCDPGEECSDDGLCVPIPGAICTTNDDCGDLVCIDGICQPCIPGAGQCGPGRRCRPADRICVDDPTAGTDPDAGVGGAYAGIPLDATDSVQGGALTCAAKGGSRAAVALLVLGMALLAAAACRRRRG